MGYNEAKIYRSYKEEKMTYKIININAGSSANTNIGTYRTLKKAREIRNQFKIIGDIKNIKIVKVKKNGKRD